MSRFGLRISLLAAVSLLFANIACTCAVAEIHAGHEATSNHAAHQVHHEQVHHGHHSAHAEHHHDLAALADEPQQDQDTEPADPSCHQVLADCADCGPGVTPTAKQDRDLRLSWIQSDLGDNADLAKASLGAILDATYAHVAALPPRAWRPRPPFPGSPITRKDQLTE